MITYIIIDISNQTGYFLITVITTLFKEKTMLNGFQILEDLKSHPCFQLWEFGVVKQDTTVLAFGSLKEGTKIRVGSISNHTENDFLVLSYPDSEKEFKGNSMTEVGWFLWAMDYFNGDWEKAEDWMRS